MVRWYSGAPGSYYTKDGARIVDGPNGWVYRPPGMSVAARGGFKTLKAAKQADQDFREAREET